MPLFSIAEWKHKTRESKSENATVPHCGPPEKSWSTSATSARGKLSGAYDHGKEQTGSRISEKESL